MMTKFSERFKKLRIEKGLFQKDIAEMFNLSREAVSNWENREHQPSYEILMELAKFFNVTTDYLLGLVDEM